MSCELAALFFQHICKTHRIGDVKLLLLPDWKLRLGWTGLGLGRAGLVSFWCIEHVSPINEEAANIFSTMVPGSFICVFLLASSKQAYQLYFQSRCWLTNTEPPKLFWNELQNNEGWLRQALHFDFTPTVNKYVSSQPGISSWQEESKCHQVLISSDQNELATSAVVGATPFVGHT